MVTLLNPSPAALDQPMQPLKTVAPSASSNASQDAETQDIHHIAREFASALTEALKEGRADFSSDEAMCKKIDQLFEANPRVWGYEKQYVLTSKEDILTLLSELKAAFNLEEEKTRDYNLALEVILRVHGPAFEHSEKKINSLVDKLEDLNAYQKDLSDLSTALTAQEESGEANFSKNPEMQAILKRVHDRNPKIFENQKNHSPNKCVWKAKEIGPLRMALDSEMKMTTSEITQCTTFITYYYDQRTQSTEIARKKLDMHDAHLRSINSKMRGGG